MSATWSESIRKNRLDYAGGKHLHGLRNHKRPTRIYRSCRFLIKRTIGGATHIFIASDNFFFICGTNCNQFRVDLTRFSWIKSFICMYGERKWHTIVACLMAAYKRNHYATILLWCVGREWFSAFLTGFPEFVHMRISADYLYRRILIDSKQTKDTDFVP